MKNALLLAFLCLVPLLASCGSLRLVRDDGLASVDRIYQGSGVVMEQVPALVAGLMSGALTKEQFADEFSGLWAGFSTSLKLELAGLKESIQKLPTSAIDEIRGNAGAAAGDFWTGFTQGEGWLGALGGALVTLLGGRSVLASARRTKIETEKIAEAKAYEAAAALAAERNASRLDLLTKLQSAVNAGPSWLAPPHTQPQG